MTDVVADLRRDLDELAAYDAADWLRAFVDTVLGPGLVVRATVHSCAYAISYARPGAETTISAWQTPIAAPWWSRGDALRAALISPLVVAGLTTPLASLPSDPLLAALVGTQLAPLACDPALTLISTSDRESVT